MTVITKTVITLLKKVQLQRAAARANDENTVVYFEDEDKAEVQAMRARSLLLWLLQGVLMLGLLALVALLIYFQCFRVTTVHRYQGFCNIPIPMDAKQLMDVKRRMEPRWTSQDVQVITSLSDPSNDELVNFLREHLDIGDNMERISVYDSGRQINFIHDFNDNITGIVDVDRCFTMDLESDFVMSPAAFAASMQRGAGLDTSLLRGVWRAELPPTADLPDSWGKALCEDKPVYRLQRESVVIRKRSAEEPNHEYVQFSGKHITAIAIDNMAELFEYENKQLKKND